MSSEPEARSYPFGECDALDLHPGYREAQGSGGMARIQPPFGGWAYMATRYDDVVAVLTDERMSRAAVVGEDEPRVHPFITDGDALAALDPPEHTRLRRALMGAFTTRRMEDLRPRVQEIVDEALDDLEAHGSPADLVELFAAPVPAIVIAELLGVPPGDRMQFRTWINTVLNVAESSPEEAGAAYGQLMGYLSKALAERREQPTGDLLSALVEARDVEKLTDGEMINLATSVLMGGYETTINQIGNFTYLLLRQPEKGKQLRASPELVPTAVEELLRFTPVMATAAFARAATEEIEIGGVTVQPGEVVLPAYHLANRDERMFDDPDELDLTRGNARSHVAFSSGPHHCPGAGLARIELQSAMGSLLQRFPDLRFAGTPDDVVWKKTMTARGPKKLLVAWG